jgi:hypothetical protein
MAKKKNSPERPVVTTLPLPNSDSAMVIDLPDGQKLVVGKMVAGTVIEVATWRGTGRPDSRTTRLMLGVSSQESEHSTTSEEGGEPITPTRRRAISQLKAFFAKSLRSVASFGAKAKKFKVERPSSSPTLPTQEPVSRGSGTDVQEWLDSIIAKSDQKGAPSPTIKPQRKKAALRKSTTKKATATRRTR